MSGRKSADYNVKKQKNKIIGFILFCIIAGVVGTIIYASFPLSIKNTGSRNKLEILKAWENGNYLMVYDSTHNYALEKVDDSFWSIMNGLSAYYIGAAQITADEFRRYNDEAIFKLRRALLLNPGNMSSRIAYTLGKAYFAKGSFYCDLAIRFLNDAIDSAYHPVDIYEYLGLAYAAINDYRNSVICFSYVLGNNPSDLLLLSISRSYIELNEPNFARAYLYQCIEKSRDASVVIQARMLLARMFKALGDNANTEKEYQSIIELDDQNAEAHYALGEFYAQGGDSVRARAEWRKTIRLDPAHALARARLNI